ncbi:MAG: hypothetical protein ACM3PO_11310, partial [Betaproteobacteria bacterium]
MQSMSCTRPDAARRHFIGGSDARTIMGTDEAALLSECLGAGDDAALWAQRRLVAKNQLSATDAQQ